MAKRSTSRLPRSSPSRRRTSRNAVILVALNGELEAVKAHGRFAGEQLDSDLTFVHAGVFKGKHHNWKVFLKDTDQGNVKSAINGKIMLDRYDPHVMIFVGIAGGLKEDVRHGDVVAASKIVDYELGKVVAPSPGFHPRGIRAECSNLLVQLAKSVGRANAWKDRARPHTGKMRKPEDFSPPSAFVQPIASGEKNISTRKSQLFRILSAQFSECYACDMESFGAQSAAASTINRRPHFIAVRSISDMVSDKAPTRDRVWQPIAAAHAAAFAWELLYQLDLSDIVEKNIPVSVAA